VPLDEDELLLDDDVFDSEDDGNIMCFGPSLFK
jgi:hypothetical protein